jgi:macrolide transport system ATP-binding/permease protein
MSWLERRTRRRDSDIDDEIQAHLRMAVDDRVSRGEPTDDARRRALLEFGSVSRAREDASAVWRWTSLEQLLQDVRSGARILTTAPGLSLAAIVLVALVIGCNTSIYSMVHGMLTKPAAGVDPRQMVSIGW